NTKFHDLTFRLRNRKTKEVESENYQFLPMEAETIKENYIAIGRDGNEWNRLKPIFFEFLYLNNESLKDLRIKKNILENHKFVLEGREKKAMLTVQSIKY